ncbi:hypothetical protein Tco_0606724 [Tanacetum coccineum]
MNKKNYSFDLETFRDMLQICLNLASQKFEDPPFEEEIIAFIRKLGYSGNMKSLYDVKVETLPQPWRTFETFINKCLSSKVTGLDLFRLSQAQIMWGMYYQKNVDYVYLLWEDLVYQIENKAVKKNKDMYYPRFTKVIINHFMSKDQSIPRKNKVDWHMANNDPILSTMRFIPKHETIQKYGAILPDTLTNQSMKESNTYKTYHDFAIGKVIPKPKYVRRLTREKTDQAPTASLGKRLQAITKRRNRMESFTKRSKTQFHRSHTSGSGADEGTSVSPGVPDVPTYRTEDTISWNDDGQDYDNEQTESDNDGDDFVHPKFSTHDEEERQDEEDKKEELDEEETNEKEEVNELYRDVNVNLDGRDTEITDALLANFEDRVKALEYDFSEFKQTNLFAEAISSILSVGIKRLQGDSLSYYYSVVNTACAQLQLLSDYYCWKDYADRDETKD